MFMEVAIAAIGIGVVLMVGYLVIGQVRAALPTSGTTFQYWNGSEYLTGQTNVSTFMGATQATVFAGFGLLAVGIIVLAAFGLINVFRQ